MNTARDLLDHGLLREGAQKLVRLHDCGRKAGCDQWHVCIGLIENQWQASTSSSSLKQDTGQR
ncbi:MAG: hypothetical protein ACR2Q4_05260 [Geminicoccaceae bacterium]